jgi:formylglycine-generating enzyme required for sulfatase activity
MDATAPPVTTDDSGCPHGRGPTMARGGGDAGPEFCIDTTEVSVAQYAEMLADDGGVSVPGVFADAGAEVAAACATNVNLAPKVAPVGDPSLPAANVTWCDAFAFCAWAGKRLCGGPPVADAGGVADGGVLATEWGRACSLDGTQAYPYGNTYEAVCNVGTNGARPVGSAPACQGGYAGVSDLSGNVAEWLGSCRAAAGALLCRVGGGSYSSGPDGVACAAEVEDGALVYLSSRGVRCCASPR